jgi:hypothetical protein
VTIVNPTDFHAWFKVKSKLLLCAVHFQFNMVKKLKALSFSAEMRRIFTYGFIALINSTDINEFNRFLVCMYIVFNMEFCDDELLKTQLYFIESNTLANKKDKMDYDTNEIIGKDAKYTLYESLDSDPTEDFLGKSFCQKEGC